METIIFVGAIVAYDMFIKRKLGSLASIRWWIWNLMCVIGFPSYYSLAGFPLIVTGHVIAESIYVAVCIYQMMSIIKKGGNQ